MVSKKLEYKDPKVSVVFTLDKDSVVTIENQKILEFIKLLLDLDSVSGNTMKSWQVDNGLPLYEYSMKNKEGHKWKENVRVLNHNEEDTAFSFDVPDEWHKKIVEIYFQARRMSTHILLVHKVKKIVATWI